MTRFLALELASKVLDDAPTSRKACIRLGVDKCDRDGVGVKIGASLAVFTFEEDDGESLGVCKTLLEMDSRGPREVGMLDKLDGGLGVGRKGSDEWT